MAGAKTGIVEKILWPPMALRIGLLRLTLIHIWRWRRTTPGRYRWSPDTQNKKKTIENIQRKKYPQKRKWYLQATAILRDYMRGGTSTIARAIRSYLLGTRRRIQVRNTTQTIWQQLTEIQIEQRWMSGFQLIMCLTRHISVYHLLGRTYIRTPRPETWMRLITST